MASIMIPEALVEKELAHRGLTELHIVASMHERKALMTQLSDAFVILPGGYGTLDELFEVLVLQQLLQPVPSRFWKIRLNRLQTMPDRCLPASGGVSDFVAAFQRNVMTCKSPYVIGAAMLPLQNRKISSVKMGSSRRWCIFRRFRMYQLSVRISEHRAAAIITKLSIKNFVMPDDIDDTAFTQ